MAHQVQVIARHDVAVTSPTYSPSGELVTIAYTGEIFKYLGNVELDSEFRVVSVGSSSGQPLGVVYDSSASKNTDSVCALVCDAAHQAVLRISRSEDEQGGIFAKQEVVPYVREYEGAPLLGPNSITLCPTNGSIYFTDSGPLGETSIQDRRGSLFSINQASQMLVPLALRCLAHPSGVAVSGDGKVVYVAETNMNRVLRIVENPPNVFHCTVFIQLSGRFGPTALAISNGGELFVGHFDFVDSCDIGKVLVVDSEGEVSAVLSCPGPEITGLCLSPEEKFLIITEGSTKSVYKHPIR